MSKSRRAKAAPRALAGGSKKGARKAAGTKNASPPPAATSEKKVRRKDEDQRGFLPEVLDRTVIAIPLLNKFEKPQNRGKVFDIVVDLNLNFQGGLIAARTVVEGMIDALIEEHGKLRTTGANRPALLSRVHVDEDVTGSDVQYVFASLDKKAIEELARIDSTNEDGTPKARWERAIYHIWPDFALKALINKSISTVKADAAHNSFDAAGADIVWAVIDSGIDQTHPHFAKYDTLKPSPPLEHKDFTGGGEPLADAKGHGTHVAGIIAGEVKAGDLDAKKRPYQIVATQRYRDHSGDPAEMEVKPPPEAMQGMAPRCKLLSLKVLDSDGKDDRGTARGIISALQYVNRLNGNGRRILVHGVNLSVGYDFEPEWFGCGQSPLCVEVDRLVRSGVVVVVAAGNSGYGIVNSEGDGPSPAGLALTINDPGNAEAAITVGSTHRDMPHTYGVSYFSSKGPTGDGRIKPDLVAPGEKVISCESSQMAMDPARKRPALARGAGVARYREDSGTSMAAPHVSGVIAAFLSIRKEYIGHPEEVKRIFTSTATDLNRERYFQGRGLVDVMRAIQSI